MIHLAIVVGMLAASLLPSLALAQTPTAAQSSTATLAPAGEDADGIEMAWTLPPFTLDTITFGERSFTTVSAEGLVSGGMVGAPELPILSARAVVPSGVPVQLEILGQDTEAVALEAPPLPVARVASDGWTPEKPGAPTYVREMEPALYAVSPDLCTITADEQVRSWRLVQVTCLPMRYRAEDRSLLITKQARIRLAFANPPSSEAAASAQSADPLAGSVALGVLNPTDLARFAQPTSPLSSQADLPAVAGRYRLQTAAAGIHVVTYDELVAAGVPLQGIASASLRLFNGGQEVALLIEDPDGTFGPGDRFFFYAWERPSVYGTDNSYSLDWGGADGLRLGTRAASAAGANPEYLMAQAHLRNYDPRYSDPWRSTWTDVNVYEHTYSPIADDGHFYAGTAMTRGAADMPDREWFAVEVPAAPNSQGTLSIPLRGMTEDAHHLLFDFGTQTNNAPFSVYVPFLSRIAPPGATSTATRAFASEPPYTHLGDRTWAGLDPVTYDFPVTVTDGLNLLRVSLPGQDDGQGGILVERTDVVSPRLLYPVGRVPSGSVVAAGQAGAHSYRLPSLGSANARVWDVSDPYSPIALTGVAPSTRAGQWELTFGDSTPAAALYAIAGGSGLKRVTGVAALAPVEMNPAAQYLVITHPDFLAAAEALTQHRQAQSGLSTRIITTQAIYDRFSGGLLDPEAIRSFITAAYQAWTGPGDAPLLTYVVLIGDGSYDFKDRLNHGAANYIPPYLGEDFDPHWGGQSGSDHIFGNARRTPPSVLIGRIPARTAVEAMGFVLKLKAYETGSTGNWLERALFAADDPDERDYGTGEVLTYGFDEMADLAVDSVIAQGRLSASNVKRVYHSAVETTQPNYYYNDSDAGTNAVLDSWRAGSLITYFAGHSHYWGWAFPKLFNTDDIPGMGPTPFTVLLSMTCFTGVFYHPTAPSLDEALLLAADRGTVSSFSPMSMGSAAGHRMMQATILQALLEGRTLGEAMLAGKLKLGYAYLDLIDSYTVLGDPAVRLATPSVTPPASFITLVPFLANQGG